MQSKATTVEQYLAELPPERREAIGLVRKLILKNMDKAYREGMQYGMIGYSVPHSLYPAGYHCDPTQPLPFACLASQKNYMSLYLMTMCDENDMWFRDEWAKTGKKLDMGKSCIRFKSVDDLALDVIVKAIKRLPLKKYVHLYETLFKNMRAEAAAKRKKEGPKRKAAPARKVAKKKVRK